MKWVEQTWQTLGDKWRTLGEKQSSVKDAIVLAVIASFILPAVLIVIERQFPPADTEPDLFYSLYHSTKEVRTLTGPARMSHVYKIKIGNRGPSLEDTNEAEFMMVFRRQMLGVAWERAPTRDSAVQKCEGVLGKMYHFYLKFRKLGRQGHFVAVVTASDELSHVPKLHLDSRDYFMDECKSTTQEGKEFCAGSDVRATELYDGFSGSIDEELDCSKL